ncbi:MAG: hypothetical protein LW860_08410 [Xanthomonadaceae bacterium]|jgi:hypothetical protein|nr:hypothetical protein [Xanthomonadaceae bacterium]
MNRRPILIAAVATALLAGVAFAQAPAVEPASPSPAHRAGADRLAGGAPMHGPRAARGGRAARLAATVRHDPALAVVVNLRAIERVYRADGRGKELPAFYREQLGKTNDPVVRNFVNYRLARLEMRADDAEAALQALRRNLEENYRRL